MYLWDVRGLAQRLKKGRVKEHEFTAYCILSPLLSISNGLFFGLLLFSHQIIEHSFKGWLGSDHPFFHFYNFWSLSMTALTILVSFSGIYLCYKTNQKGDGKDFWKRMACLSFPVNFHIIIYSLAILSITGVLFYFALQSKIMHFQESLLPGSTLQGVTKPSLGLFSGIALLRSLPEKFNFFLQEARSVILIGYPILSLIPPFLSFSHYMIVRKLIKQVAKK